MSPTIKLLRELIALPSVNPAFVALEDPRAGEHRVADFLASTAAQAGLDVELHDVFPRRPNVLARLVPAGRATRRVVLAPHIDTVGAGSAEAFRPVEKNGRLHGRGACDTKGSIAAMLTALCKLAGSIQRPKQTEVLFAALVDEENRQSGSRALAGTGLRADLAIVGEPTGLRIVTAHKGDLWLQLETRGKAAHGALPELGRNAVHEMSKIVDLLETDYAATLRKRRHPLLGHPTINVGTIAGGTQPNIVPDSCLAGIDRRTIPGETEPGIRRELKMLLRRHGLNAKLLKIRNGPCPPMETNPRRPLVMQFLASTGQTGPAGVHYFCDAAILSRAGIPSVVFGPGDIAQAHTADEWISVAEANAATLQLFSFLQSLP